MDSVRIDGRAPLRVLHRVSCLLGTRAPQQPRGPTSDPPGVLVLDVIYLALTIALFAIVGLVAKGVEKL